MGTKIDSVARIPTTINDFFKCWLEFLKPFHQLTGREIDVAASFIKQRYNLSKVITEESILNKVLMNEDTRKIVRQECGLSIPHFQVILGKLRKSKVIINNIINPKFIPNINESNGNFQLLLLFDFSKNENK